MANLERDALEGCGNDGQRGHIFSMAVALDHLGSDGRGGETQALANFLLDIRPQMRASAYRAGNFADPHLARGSGKALRIAAIFRVPVGNLQAKGDWLGVDTVRAAD